MANLRAFSVLLTIFVASCDLDVDGDGYTVAEGDCMDNDVSVHSGATEVCNHFDDDCDGALDESLTCDNTDIDEDHDGYTVAEGDCDDTNPAVNPGAIEIVEDVPGMAAVDNDCDGSTGDYDSDGDGFTVDAGDCDDSLASINPSATEVCDGFDNDCDGSADDDNVMPDFYRDADGDGYGDPSGWAGMLGLCDPPAGYVADDGDCDDTDALIHPGADEIAGDGIDQDCDGLADD